MGLKFTNFARAKIATPPSGTGGLSFTVEAGKGALFPVLGAGDYFYGVFKNATKANNEVVKVEARSTDAMTIATGGRGADGTTAQTWTTADYFELCMAQAALAEAFNAAIAAIGALTPAANKVPYFTGAAAAANADLTAFARTLLDDADGPSVLKTLYASSVLARSSNTILAAADCAKAVIATSTFTQTLTAAATLGNGWSVEYRNAGTGVITIDPDGAETIDGYATLKLYPGDSCLVVCNGTAFHTVGLQDGPRIIQEQSPSAVATVDFTAGIDSNWDFYDLDYDLVPATDDDYLFLRVGTGGTPTWQSGGGAYAWAGRIQGPSSGADSGSTVDAITTLIPLSRPGAGQGVGSDLGEHVVGSVRIYRPSSGALYVSVAGRSAYQRSDAAGILFDVAGHFGGTGVTALRLAFSSGNIESGVATLRAHRKARS